VISGFSANCALLDYYSPRNSPAERSSHTQCFLRQQEGTTNSRAVRDQLHKTNSYATLDPVYLAQKYTQL